MTTTTPLVLEHDYSIRSYEPRPDGRVSIATICNQLQDIASRHADSLGFGYHDLEQSGHFWILARLHLMMDRLPGYGGQTTLTTWPSGHERLVALRDFLIRDKEGAMGRSTSSWVTLNRETHRPDNPEEVLHRRFIPDRQRALTFPTKAISRLKHGEFQSKIITRRFDLDINGHVNNVHYVEYCLESMPQAWLDSHRCTGLDIQFRAESFAGEELTASCSPSEPDNGRDTWLHSLVRTSDNRESIRMRTWWQPL